MLYFDIDKNVVKTRQQLLDMGLPVYDDDELRRLGYFPLVIDKPEYDPETEGIEPDGCPVQGPDMPVTYIQHMRVYNVLHRFKIAKKQDATALRWAHETGGLSIFTLLPPIEVPPLVIPDGCCDDLKFSLEETWRQEVEEAQKPHYSETRILTGIDDQNRISTALQGMKDNGMAEVDFKAASGWVKLTLEELQNIAGVIAAHVQECFSNERRLHEAIDACATLGELNAIDLEEGWPEYRAPALA